ncbi:MAG: T9SS type A sorting domain-containing protein [Bacteroidota bacterium]
MFFLLSTGHAQIPDTISTNAGYSDQVWYSFRNGEEARAPQAEWDLAFEISGFSSAIHLNTVTGAQVWLYPNGDTAQWSTVDTAGIGNWTDAYNADTSWTIGALNAGFDPNDDFDLGWGTYNFITHHVTGDSLFVVKLADGSYKKLWIELLASGIYSFRHADLDGSNEIRTSVAKADYQGKNFAYYSMSNDAYMDREPMSADWDLLFGRYTAALGPGVYYPVTGVLANAGVETARVYPVDDPMSYDYNAASFSTEINTIGWDWKTFDFMTNSFVLEDSMVFFAKAKNGAYWRMVMTAFGGSANGNFIFNTEQLTNATDIEADIPVAFFSAYPNPATDQRLVVAYDLPLDTEGAALSLFDLQGRTIFQQQLTATGSLQRTSIELPGLAAGVYTLSLRHEAGVQYQKLIIR